MISPYHAGTESTLEHNIHLKSLNDNLKSLNDNLKYVIAPLELRKSLGLTKVTSMTVIWNHEKASRGDCMSDHVCGGDTIDRPCQDEEVNPYGEQKTSLHSTDSLHSP